MSGTSNRSPRVRGGPSRQIVPGRWWQKLLLLLVLAGAGWGYWFLHSAERFPINHVKVVGDYSNVDQQALKAAITPFVVDGFFAVKVKKIQQQIGVLPWVANVVVAREWPDQVVVTITQEKAVGRWNDSGVFTAEERIFYPASETLPAAVPQLSGPEGQLHFVYQNYQQMMQILRPSGLQIKKLALKSRRAWHLLLDNDLELIITRDNYQNSLRKFCRIYPGKLQQYHSAINYVDLRYSNGMAVHWKSEASRS